MNTSLSFINGKLIFFFFFCLDLRNIEFTLLKDVQVVLVRNQIAYPNFIRRIKRIILNPVIFPQFREFQLRMSTCHDFFLLRSYNKKDLFIIQKLFHIFFLLQVSEMFETFDSVKLFLKVTMCEEGVFELYIEDLFSLINKNVCNQSFKYLRSIAWSGCFGNGELKEFIREFQIEKSYVFNLQISLQKLLDILDLREKQRCKLTKILYSQ